MLSGALTDRVGRRRVYLVACVFAAAWGFPMFMLANSGVPLLMMLVFVFGVGIIHASFTGTQGSWFAELFKTNTRTSGASLGYQVAASISGFAPFIAVLLATKFGWVGPAGFYVFIALVGLTGVLLTRDTWGLKQREEVDSIIRTGQVTAAGERASASVGTTR